MKIDYLYSQIIKIITINIIYYKKKAKISNKVMFETVLLFNSQSYPFESHEESTNIKLQKLIHCKNGNIFGNEKKKYQVFKCLQSQYTIKLQQIFQEHLILHLIYEYIPFSLKSCLRNWVQKEKGENWLGEKKKILRNIAQDLGQLCEFLQTYKIFTHFIYNNFGVKKDKNNFNTYKIKYFVGSSFEFTDHSQEELKAFYLQERKKILLEVQKSLNLQKREDYLPNYILRGSNLIFTDDLSQAKNKKKAKESFCQSQPCQCTHGKQKYKKFQQSKHNKTNTNPKQHNYCNSKKDGVNYEFGQQNLNQSFDETQKNQSYSITQTKSVKVQVQQQKASLKNRRNSFKFKITTFQQISIDDQVPQQQYDIQDKTNTSSNPPDPQRQSYQTHKKKQFQSKNYTDKIKQAKAKVQVILNKYMESKSRFSWK